MSKLLIVGASRGTGLETVKAALAAGHNVRAFAPSAAAIPLASERLEKVSGDARHRAALEAAVTGMDAVIETLGVSFGLSTIVGGTTLFSSATRLLVEAMRAKGVHRLVAVTGIGAGNSRGHGGFLYDAVAFPLVLARVYDDKDVQEQIIRNSGLTWTIVRPAILTNGPATGRYHVLTDPSSWRGGFISRANVAHFLVREATENRYAGETPLLIE